MAVPYTDKPNPFTELSSEQPAADNIAVARAPRKFTAGEVIPGDVAAYTMPGTEPVGRSADVDVAPGSLAEGAESTSTATAANDSPIAATVAAGAGADMEASARELQQGGGRDVRDMTTASAAGGVGQEEGFQQARGGVAAAERAAEMRGVGVPPTRAVGGDIGGGRGGGSGGQGREFQRGGDVASGEGKGGSGGVGAMMSSVVKGVAGLVTGSGRESSSTGRDSSDVA